MIVEEERLAVEAQQLKAEKEFLMQQIKAGERYERLLVNKDFQDMLKDLETTVKVHSSQLEILDIDLQECNSPFKINRIASVRKTHLERMMQIKIAIRRPQQLVDLGNKAKQRLSEINKLEREGN